LLVIGFICNFLVKAVDARYHMRVEGENGTEPGANATAPAAARA